MEARVLMLSSGALLWPRVLWSPLAFGNQGSLYLRYGLLAGVPVQDICDAGGWSMPNFPGSTTWLCEPPLACLFPCHSCAFHTLSRDLQVWRRGYLVPLAFRRSSMFPEGNVPGYVCNPGSPRERDAASQGHTSGIPNRAMLHSWKLAPAAHLKHFKHPGHDVTAPDVWPSILTDYTYDSELDNADGVPLAFRRSVSFPRGTRVPYLSVTTSYVVTT